MRKSALWTSILLHLTPLLLVLLVRVAVPVSPVSPTVIHINPPLRAPRLQPDSGGGGGDTALPARKGRAPTPVLRKVFVLPMLPQVDQPKLPVVTAMLETPSFNVEAAEIGDPLGRSQIGGPGRHGLVGIGDVPGTGIGKDNGTGLGGSDAKRVTIKVTRHPEAIYKPEPDYSEEARKARFQGVVVLAVEVGTDGQAHDIRVIRGLGMGLDDKAIEAVMRWRFRPALAGGQPVAVPATVEVAFHLL
jgi:periplasmic protein TonB